MYTELLVYVPGRASGKIEMADLSDMPSLDEIKSAVVPLLGSGCMDLEHVSVLYNGKRADMFVDEFSSIVRPKDGRYPLPVNEAATDIYHAASRMRGENLTNAPKIHGPAVVSLRRIWF
jgi:hypothetical protein